MGAENELQFDAWIADAQSDSLDDSDIARMAETLATSGERLKRRDASADLASTGGPGSISTLWGPAAIVANGVTVAKLGVPGRPAGGVDVLMQIDGYRTDLDAARAEKIIEQCGYVHLLAGARFARADAAMFAYRQSVSAQHLPALAIASLLSKKLATGTAVAGLEVRVAPHGNFGPDREEARRNAFRFCRVAGLLGIDGICFLTDGTAPQQPYLGRGEAIVALSHLLRGTECEWLARHGRQCEEWAGTIAGGTIPDIAETRRAFVDNVAAQGGEIDALHKRARSVTADHTRVITATEDGRVRYDLGRLREAILAARQPDRKQDFDDSAGLILLARPGSTVSSGEPLLSARCGATVWGSLSRAIADAVRIDGAESSDDVTLGDPKVEMISV